MDYISIFSDLNKFEEQLLPFIEIYYNELNKENKELLASINNWEDQTWKNKMKLYLDNYLKTENHFNEKRIEKLLEHFKEKNNKKINFEFNNKIDISELLYEILFIKKNGSHYKKTSESIKFNMIKNIFKELIHIVKLIKSKSKENINTPFEFLLRFYEDQYYFIKIISQDFENIKLSDYAIKELKIKILIYLNKNLNSEYTFELNPLKEEFIDFYENNNNAIIKNNDFFINNNYKANDALNSMFEFVPFKLPNFNFKNDKNSEIEEKQKKKKNYNNINNDDEDDFEDQIHSFSNSSSILEEENNDE